MQFSRPMIITSPISGEPVRPLIKELIVCDKLVKEAHYIDPKSGIFIRKIKLSEEDLPSKSPKEESK